MHQEERHERKNSGRHVRVDLELEAQCENHRQQERRQHEHGKEAPPRLLQPFRRFMKRAGFRYSPSHEKQGQRAGEMERVVENEARHMPDRVSQPLPGLAIA